MTTRVLGKVARLFRYPVKSMGSEELHSVEVEWHGFKGDRRWAFVQAGKERSGFPWLTIRERPQMWHYQPYHVDPNDVEKSVTMVRTPSGHELDVVDPALAVELAEGARVIKDGRGIFDTMPLSLITLQTISALGASVGYDFDPRRFRPNLVIDSIEGGDAPEMSWIGDTLEIGSMRMRVDKRDKRCVLINVDPESTEKDPQVLRTVAQERDACLGVYGSVVQVGTVKVGDTVTVVG